MGGGDSTCRGETWISPSERKASKVPDGFGFGSSRGAGKFIETHGEDAGSLEKWIALPWEKSRRLEGDRVKLETPEPVVRMRSRKRISSLESGWTSCAFSAYINSPHIKERRRRRKRWFIRVQQKIQQQNH